MYIVKKNFSGIVNGVEGQIIELNDKYLIDDLVHAGYIETYSNKNENTNDTKKVRETSKKKIVNITEENNKLEK